MNTKTRAYLNKHWAISFEKILELEGKNEFMKDIKEHVITSKYIFECPKCKTLTKELSLLKAMDSTCICGFNACEQYAKENYDVFEHIYVVIKKGQNY